MCFHHFYFFSLFFLMKYQISKIDINQSETGIGDKRLALELYVCKYLKILTEGNFIDRIIVIV